MKVAVITRHAISNYGSLLQAIATQKLIEGLGDACEIIDYVRTDEEPQNWEKTTLSCKVGWNNSLLKKGIYLVLRAPESIKAGRKFAEMQKKYLHLTSRYHSQADLKCNPPEADLYMTGSDQVWGPVCNGSYDSSYFLSFVPEHKGKVAFAASMGKMKLDDTAQGIFEQYLPAYRNIAVREDTVADFLRKNGIVSNTVLDPTLMLDGDTWRKFVKDKKKDRSSLVPKGKYILVYQIHNGKELNACAKEISKRLGLPLLRVSPMFHQISRGGKFVYLPDVTDFLNLIDNASFMMTDSFHGTAFAINFNTPFAEILPDSGTSSRNVSILNLTGLSNRIVTNQEQLDKMEMSVDFSNANRTLNEKRNESMAILKYMLKKID